MKEVMGELAFHFPLENVQQSSVGGRSVLTPQTGERWN